jgi:glycosyltransferase involved in cell wall biosynthesis
MYQACDEDLKAKTIYLSDYGNKVALKALGVLRPSMIKAITFSMAQTGMSFKSLMGNALKLAYIAKQQNCTHLHAHFAQGASAIAIVAARLCGLSVSFVGHGHDIYAFSQDLPLKLKSVDFAVAVCLDMAWHFRNIAPKVNTSLVYCGVETHRFCKDGSERVYPPNSQPLDPHQDRLLFIGRLCETKGLFTLLNALAKVEPELRPNVDFVGAGVLLEQLEAHRDELGLTDKVSFLGPKQSTWFIDHAKDYAGLLVPFEMAPNGDRDSGPVVIKEAMALRLPIITTYFMGCKEMLTQECALRAPPKDPVSLAKTIKRFYGMSSVELGEMVENAYERVNSHYSSDLQAVCLSTMVEQT